MSDVDQNQAYLLIGRKFHHPRSGGTYVVVDALIYKEPGLVGERVWVPAVVYQNVATGERYARHVTDFRKAMVEVLTRKPSFRQSLGMKLVKVLARAFNIRGYIP